MVEEHPLFQRRRLHLAVLAKMNRGLRESIGLAAGAAKAFGFAGAAFVDAKMLAKAVQQTLETTALALAARGGTS